jgi:hypothetical protein
VDDEFQKWSAVRGGCTHAQLLGGLLGKTEKLTEKAH